MHTISGSFLFNKLEPVAHLSHVNFQKQVYVVIKSENDFSDFVETF